MGSFWVWVVGALLQICMHGWMEGWMDGRREGGRCVAVCVYIYICIYICIMLTMRKRNPTAHRDSITHYEGPGVI